jgi:hypothetical protein
MVKCCPFYKKYVLNDHEQLNVLSLLKDLI